MASKKYVSSRCTTNSARLYRLLQDPCTDLFRDLLAARISHSNFTSELIKHKNTLKPLLNKTQRNLLHPQGGVFNGNYNLFDLSLLYLLLRNICSISPHSNGWGKPPLQTDRSLAANIERIRIIRNSFFGHSTSSALPDPELSAVWQEIRQVIVELEAFLGKPSAPTFYQDAVNFLEMETMDPEMERSLLQQLDEERKTNQNFADRLDQLTEKLQEFDQHHREHTMQITKILGSSEESEQKIVIANTKSVLHTHAASTSLLYSSTRREIAVIETLDKFNICIITGTGGDGKTTTAYEVLNKLSLSENSSQWIPIIVDEPEQWDRVVHPDKLFLVYIDNFLGKTNVNKLDLIKWERKFDKMNASVLNGNIKLLLSIRKSILQDVFEESYPHHLLDRNHIIDFSEKKYNLSVGEKKEMVSKYGMAYRYVVSDLEGSQFREYEAIHGASEYYVLDKEMVEKIVEMHPYYGFPLSCFLFFSNKELFQLGMNFFNHPDKQLFNEIDNMRKCKKRYSQIKYIVLVSTFLQGFFMHNDYNMHICEIDKVAEMLHIQGIVDYEIDKAVSSLNGTFLIKSDVSNKYTFYNEAVGEAVMLSYGKLAPEVVIKNCPLKTLNELVTTENAICSAGEIVLKVPPKNYQILINRLFGNFPANYIVENDKSCKAFFFDVVLRVIHHRATSDPDFVDKIFTIEAASSRDFIRQIWEHILDNEHELFLDRVLKKFGPGEEENKFIAAVEVTDRLLEAAKILKHKTVHQILNFIFKEKDVFEEIIHENWFRNHSFIGYAVSHGWHDIIELLKMNHFTIQTNFNEWSCIHISAYFGRFSLLKMFEETGCTLNDKSYDGFSVMQTLLMGMSRGPGRKECNFLCKKSCENIICEFPPENEYIKLFEYMVQKNIGQHDINFEIDQFGNKILHYVVFHNCISFLKCLIRTDKNVVFQRNGTKMSSALHLAAFLGKSTIFDILWNNRLRPMPNEMSLVHCASKGLSYCSQKIIRDKTVSYSMTFVYSLKNFVPDLNESVSLTFGEKQDFSKIILHLLVNEPDISSNILSPIDEYENSLIHYLVCSDIDEVLQELVRNHPESIMVRNDTLLPTALHVSVYTGRFRSFRLLWDKGLRPSEKDISLFETAVLGSQFSGNKFKTLSSQHLLKTHYSGLYFHDRSEFEKILQWFSLHRSEFGLDSTVLKETLNVAVISDISYAVDIIANLDETVFKDWTSPHLPTILHLCSYLGRHNLFIKISKKVLISNKENVSLLKTCLLGRLLSDNVLKLRRNCWYFLNSEEFQECLLEPPSCSEVGFGEDKEFCNLINFILQNTTHPDVSSSVDEYESSISHILIYLNDENNLNYLFHQEREALFGRNTTKLPTTIHAAGFLGRYEIFKKLWSIGVRPKENDLPLAHVISLGNVYCGKTIVNKGEERGWFTYIYDRCEGVLLKTNKHAEIVFNDHKGYEAILLHIFSQDRGIPDSKLECPIDRYGYFVPHYLVIFDYLSVLKIIAKSDNNILHVRCATDLPSTIHVACFLGRYRIVRLLLKHGVWPSKDELDLRETAEYGKLFCGKRFSYQTLFDWRGCEFRNYDGPMIKVPDIQLMFGSENEYNNVISVLQEEQEQEEQQKPKQKTKKSVFRKAISNMSGMLKPN